MLDDLSLHGSIDDLTHMGSDPALPTYDPDLAGVQGVPTPTMLARAVSPAIPNAPTFTAPELITPALSTNDLDPAGIDLRPPFSSDPLLPDLTEYAHPDGVTLHTQELTAGPMHAEPSIPVTGDAMVPDPLLPDLQHPDLTPLARMLDRPGDLDASALTVMQQSATYQQNEQKRYPAVFMDQSGVNTTRTRHMEPLMQGLEEC